MEKTILLATLQVILDSESPRDMYESIKDLIAELKNEQEYVAHDTKDK